MEFSKDYFPTAKAPPIAREKIMQHIYPKAKSLTKRFYFYRVYAWAFVVLFVVRWAVVFYNKELNVSPNIASIQYDNIWSQESLMQKNIQESSLSDMQIVDWELDYTKSSDQSDIDFTTSNPTPKQQSPESYILQQPEISSDQQSPINTPDSSQAMMIDPIEQTNDWPMQDGDILLTRTASSLNDLSIDTAYDDSPNNIDQNILEIENLINELLIIIQQE